MSERAPGDGEVEVMRVDGGILLAVTTNGERQFIRMGKWNARRALAGLSAILELPLSRAAQKAIRL